MQRLAEHKHLGATTSRAAYSSKAAAEHILEEEAHEAIGQLGSRSGAHSRIYDRLKSYVEVTQHSLFPPPIETNKVIEDTYRYPLKSPLKIYLTASYDQASVIAILPIW